MHWCEIGDLPILWASYNFYYINFHVSNLTPTLIFRATLWYRLLNPLLMVAYYRFELERVICPPISPLCTAELSHCDPN